MFGKSKEAEKSSVQEMKKDGEKRQDAEQKMEASAEKNFLGKKADQDARPVEPAGKKPDAQTKAESEKKPSPEAIELASSKLALAASQAALDAAQKNLAATKEQLLRTMADFDNYRKRQARDQEQTVKRANEHLLEDLLPVVDHIELALSKLGEEKENPVVEGFRMVYSQFVETLGRHGLKPIDAKGKKFDPTFHEALSQMPSPTVPAQFVMDRYRRGWMLADRLLRPAQVIVSSGKPQETKEQTVSDEESVTD